MIRFDSVSKRYPDGTLAVADVRLDIPVAKITMLVGPSGCGTATDATLEAPKPVTEAVVEVTVTIAASIGP
jgi:ABC-type ATPase involved in cell division